MERCREGASAPEAFVQVPGPWISCGEQAWCRSPGFSLLSSPMRALPREPVWSWWWVAWLLAQALELVLAQVQESALVSVSALAWVREQALAP